MLRWSHFLTLHKVDEKKCLENNWTYLAQKSFWNNDDLWIAELKRQLTWFCKLFHTILYYTEVMDRNFSQTMKFQFSSNKATNFTLNQIWVNSSKYLCKRVGPSGTNAVSVLTLLQFHKINELTQNVQVILHLIFSKLGVVTQNESFWNFKIQCKYPRLSIF